MGSRARLALFIAINLVCTAFVNAVADGCGEKAPCPPSSSCADMRNQPKPGEGGTIEGKVFHLKGSEPELRPYFGFRIQAVHLLSRKVRATDITDERGHFSLRVPAGMYRIEPAENEYLKIAGNSDGDSVEVSVEDSKCVFRELHVTNNSFISGVVLDEDGNNISAYRLELITPRKSDGDREFYARQQPRLFPDGFRFEQIPPGSYLLSFNYLSRPDDDMPYPTWFYPGTLDRTKATLFRIEEGTTVAPVAFKLPPKLQKVSLSGLVVWKDGRAAVGAEVQLIDSESGDEVFRQPPVADSNGRFTIDAFADRSYTINVTAWEKWPDGSEHAIGEAETEVFTLGLNTLDQRIELLTVDPRSKWRPSKSVGKN